jgi:hypothetical protein
MSRVHGKSALLLYSLADPALKSKRRRVRGRVDFVGRSPNGTVTRGHKICAFASGDRMRAMWRAYLHSRMVGVRRWSPRAASVAMRRLRHLIRNDGAFHRDLIAVGHAHDVGTGGRYRLISRIFAQKVARRQAIVQPWSIAAICSQSGLAHCSGLPLTVPTRPP